MASITKKMKVTIGSSWRVRVAVVTVLALAGSSVFAARISDIRNTKHNFSATLTPGLPGGQSRVVSATTEGQICVFCHTPHAADTTAPGPCGTVSFPRRCTIPIARVLWTPSVPDKVWGNPRVFPSYACPATMAPWLSARSTCLTVA